MTIDLLEEIREELRGLGGVKAPATLRPAVLEAAGVGDAYTRLETPIGPVFIAYNRDGISAVMRTDSAVEFERWFGERFERPLRPVTSLPAALARALAAELSGSGHPRLRFDLRRLTDFERDVLVKTLQIPRGEVRTYAWVAREIGRPKAVRAVGTALANNPIAVLIPCHRVVRSDGVIGEYGAGGPPAKKAILGFEGVDPQRLERLARAGVRYHGSKTTRTFCFPTCRHARRVADTNLVGFRSESDALAAGYRACRVCRPAAYSNVAV